jgi:hypothetical protein
VNCTLGYTLTATELSLTARRRHCLRKLKVGVHGGYAYGYNYRLQPTFEPLQVRRPWQSLKFDTLNHSTTVGTCLHHSVCIELGMQWWIRPAPLGPHNLPASAGSRGAPEVRGSYSQNSVERLFYDQSQPSITTIVWPKLPGTGCSPP